MFKKIGIAVSFSPYGKSLFKIAAFLQKELSSQLYLMHIGNFSEEKENRVKALAEEFNIDESAYKIEFKKDEPSKALAKFVETENLDLLILGALEKETTLKYYVGSVARNLMRSAPTNLLICPAKKEAEFEFNNLFITTDYSSRSESAIKFLADFGKQINSKKIVVIREFNIPGLAVTVDDFGSANDAEYSMNNLVAEEKEKLDFFLKEINIKDIAIESVCLYGKEGFASNKFVKDNNADLSVITAPLKRPKLFDRIFTSEIEFNIKEIPSPLLILKKF